MLAFWHCFGPTRIWHGSRHLSRRSLRLVGQFILVVTTIAALMQNYSAAAFRMILTPIDTLKTTLQAQGARGTSLLRERIRTDGIGSLWWGSFATAAATFVGHYPWFATVCTQYQIQTSKGILTASSTTSCLI
jgi:hypothetical protein